MHHLRITKDPLKIECFLPDIEALKVEGEVLTQRIGSSQTSRCDAVKGKEERTDVHC